MLVRRQISDTGFLPGVYWPAVLLALSITGSCAQQHSDPAAADNAIASSGVPNSIDAMVDKHYWLNPPAGSVAHVCLSLDSSPPWKGCPRAASGQFDIEKVVTGKSGSQFFQVRVEGKEAYLPVSYKDYFSAEDPAFQNLQRDEDQRSKTCNPEHLKAGMGWSEIQKFCPGMPDQRITSATAMGESVMVRYLQAPGPTYIDTLNGVVTSVQLLEGY